MTKIAIIDYDAGNIRSVQLALQRLGFQAVLTNNPQEIESADKVIFPGVGEAASAMKKLQKNNLDKLIPTLQQPVLGICLGMQLMCNKSEEGNTQGLGIWDVDIIKFDNRLKVPQIGWNSIFNLQSPLFNGINEHEFVYMVHSYYAPVCAANIADCDYGITYSAALQKDNFYGVQFHPEKSSKTGEQILRNFLEL